MPTHTCLKSDSDRLHSAMGTLAALGADVEEA